MDSHYSYFLGGIGLVVGIFAGAYGLARSCRLPHVPALRPSDPVVSGWFVITYVTSAIQMVQKGFNKVIQSGYILGPQIHHNPYHVSITREHFKHHPSDLFLEVRDEMCAAVDELLDLKPDEWRTIPISATSQTLLCRINNRALIGFPLCRDPDWLDFTLQAAFAIMVERSLIGHLPDFLALYVATFITKASSRIKRGAKHLYPLIEERQKCMQEYGARWRDKPVDILQCYLDDGDEITAPLLVTQILTSAFASIYSTSTVFSKVICLLAKHPQYIEPLREEAEKVVSKNGWSEDAVAKMRKIDSFIKEALRFESSRTIGPIRKAREDVTLSNGLFIPRGTTISFAAHAIEHDERTYKNPNVFEPFRFVDLQDRSNDPSKYHLTSVSNDCLAFGIGKRACPGRFVAAMILKTLLAHLLMTFDLKPAEELPRNQEIKSMIPIDPKAKIMLRKRMD